MRIAIKSFCETRYRKWLPNKADILRFSLIASETPSHGTVLDIGCYDGSMSSEIKQDKQLEVFGIDISRPALTIANKSLFALQCDLEVGFPFHDNAFDCVIAGEVIEHVYDTDYLVSECNRVMKHAGTLIITTPNLASFGSRIFLLFGKKPWMIEERVKVDYAGHIRAFTAKELKLLLIDHGFDIVKLSADVTRILPGILSRRLARLMPTLGLHIIAVARKP